MLVPWLASTATFRPPLNAGSMTLEAQLAGNGTEWERRGNGERNGEGDGQEGQGRRVTDKERRRASRAEERRPTEGESKKEKPLSSYLLFLLLVLVCMGKAGGGSLNNTPIFSMSPDLYSAPL